MGRDPQRVRVSSLVPLWSVFTRVLVSDPPHAGWGVSLALGAALFFFFVGRSQKRWLGHSHAMWWGVACRAEIAAFAALAAPNVWWMPLWVFLLAFKATSNTHAEIDAKGSTGKDGGALWRAAPLLLLVHPRQLYLADVAGTALLVAARHRELAPSITSAADYHAQHERFVCVDALSCLVLTCAGASAATRLTLLAGTCFLGTAVHLKYPRGDVGEWDVANRREKTHMPVPYRGVNDA